MSKELVPNDKSGIKQVKSVEQALDKQRPVEPQSGAAQLLHLQRQVGNQAVQRLLAQRSGGDGGFDLDDETANRIDQARGGGQALDEGVQRQMSETLGHDFSGVRVHNSPEADNLNQQLSAKAFTTGQDIFFKQGEYNPGSSSGQELIAHELTHVVQQSSGLVSSGSGMRVNPPGDAYEQEADSVAKQATSMSSQVAGPAASVQRQAPEEDELMTKRDETVQRQAPEEDELMTKRDETVQRQAPEEDELMTKRDEKVQRQEESELEEEDELMMKRDEAQRQEEEDELAG
jgi:hypothetical protein